MGWVRVRVRVRARARARVRARVVRVEHLDLARGNSVHPAGDDGIRGVQHLVRVRVRVRVRARGRPYP